MSGGKLIMAKQYVPLVSYTKAPSKDKWSINEERKCESRQRHWGLGFWDDERGRHTAEYGVITESMPDFCGGLLVYSPFVNVYDQERSWSEYFTSPGSIPDDEKVAIKWRQFEDTMAVNLNELIDLTGLSAREARTEVEKYCWEAIAAQVAGEQLYHGKMGWTGADHLSGRMHRLMDAMGRMGRFAITPAKDFKVPSIGDDMRERNASCDAFTSIGEWWVDRGKQWTNFNSGNTVSWVSGGLVPGTGSGRSPDDDVRCEACDWEYSRNEDDECPECGCTDFYNDDYYDEDPGLDECRYHYGKAGALVSTKGYAVRARRFFWRNG
jgi:hypothetical protein